ncbi:hypothetical protein HFO55_03220 [Rhizobium leguminosarum]|uniref:hypothetical protein n=1 Tax=Rhizobium leguminosarum TaxID=384 RepID=UPI001C95544C|nr:hypothetical protein [Rhizobium leguminosarum]MBY5566272.1 hypothetical protein [Rhizobium leguminosarum]MBY5573550.1 hypothetical protein [Rhizobium leguminosarum]
MSKAWLTKLLAGGGGLLAAAISLGYAVYEQRKANLIPQVEPATSVEAGRWKVSITASAIGAAMPNGARISPGKKTIVVEMMLENISAESSNLYGDLVRLANVPDPSKPQYYLKRDQAILWDLQPRMPEAVTAVWEVPAALKLPNVLRLRIEGALFKPRDNLYAAPGWFPSGSVAEIALPLNVVGSGTEP